MCENRYREQFNAIVEFQNKLSELSDSTFENTINFLNSLSSIFLNDKHCLQRLLLVINSSLNSEPLKICQYQKLFNFLKDKLIQYFSSDELFIMFKTNKPALLFLSNLNCFDVSSLLFLDIHNIDLLFYFAPEILTSLKNKKRKFGEINFREYLYEKMNITEHIETRAKLANIDPISIAIRDDNLEMFQDIISHSNIDEMSSTKIQYSFFEPFHFINQMIKMELLSLIEYASFFGSINIFKFLLTNDNNLTKFRGKFAIAGGNAEIIHILEENDINFNSLDCLSTAIQFNHNDIVHYLHDTKEVKYDIKLIQTCVQYENISILEEIFNETPKSNEDQSAIISAIETATNTGNLDIILYLLNQMSKRDDKIGETQLISFLNNACRFGYLDIVQYFINEKHVSYTSDLFKGLYSASEFGHISTVKFLCTLPKINLNYKYQVTTDTPLTIAAYNGHLDIVKFLYKLNGVDVNHQLYNYRTAIFRAAEGQHYEVFKFLDENASNKSDIIKIVDMGGWNLLEVASQYDCVEVIKYLIEIKGFDINSHNSMPLQKAIQNNCVNVIKYFLTLKNIKLINDDNGQTAIHFAAYYMIEDSLKIFIDSKAIDINARDKSGI